MAVVVNPKLPALSDSKRRVAAASEPATRVFIPLVTPFLYGMERAVIELFDSLRPDVEAYFLQSKQIFERQPPIILQMTRRGFSVELLPDKSDWDRLARPKSFKHFCHMLAAFLRVNVAILKAVRGRDALYVPSISAGVSSLLGATYCRLTGRRVIHHFHDLGTANCLFPLWIRLVTDFVHNTEFGLEEVAAKLPGIRRKRNFIVPNILEIDGRLPDPEDSRELAGKQNLFFVGQISRHKGVDLLLEAFTRVAPRHPDSMLHLIGGCVEDFRAELEQKIGAACLEERVKFWGFREDVTRLMRFAYVYVQSSPPSRVHESFCRGAVEAMAHAVPIVCFRSGALQEIVLHEKTGLICEESPDALAIALDRFLTDKQFREMSGRAAEERFQQKYSSSVVRPQWARVLLRRATLDLDTS